MKTDKILQWKRISLPEDLFEGERTQVLPVEERKGLTSCEKPWEEKEWLWDFPKALKEFIDEDREVFKVENSGSLRREYTFNKGDLLKENLYLFIPEGKELEITLDYHSRDFVKVFTTLHLYVEKYAKVKINRIQRLASSAYAFFETLITGEEKSTIEINDFQLGAGVKAVATEVHLEGFRSKCVIRPLYITDANTQADLSYTVYHRDQKTESKILGKGILKENSRKVFRGNLHFEKGSSKSVGREEEHCYYFDEYAKSDSIPALMCDEDDVIGEHAASIGKFHESQLFYLMSRGFSLENAKILLAQGIMDEVADTCFTPGDKEKIDREIVRLIGEL